MNVERKRRNSFAGTLTETLALAIVLMLLNSPCDGASSNPNSPPVPQSAPQRSSASASGPAGHQTTDIPLGTILAIRLVSSMSSAKSKPGQRITAKIMQDVPLPSGKTIPKGSKVIGKIVATSPAGKGANAEISFRFDEIDVRSSATSITTNLRAIAGYVEVDAAQIPAGLSSGEGEVYDWLPTKQVGGDDVFGRGGPVTKWNDSSEVVGRALMSGGVLVHISARPGTDCRGALYGNDALQALWVFSSDACGVYGMPHVAIAHAGRDQPVGLIVLRSSDGKLSLPSGTAMLLRINEIGN